MAKELDLATTIQHHWQSNQSVMFLVSEEPHQTWLACLEAIERLRKDKNMEVQAWCHDKVTGLNQGEPAIRMPKDKSHVLLNALQMAMSPPSKEDNLDTGEQRFNPADDIIFMFRDPNFDLNEGPAKPSTIQVLRNIITANMCSKTFCGFDGDEGPADDYPPPSDRNYRRGNRLLIFVSPLDKLPEDLPEIDPIVVPLPDEEKLQAAIDITLVPFVGQRDKDGLEIVALTKDERRKISQAGRGFPYQKFEDTLPLAMIENGGYRDLDGFIATIFRKKGEHFRGIPGLRYVPREEIEFDHLPGYEDAEAFIDEQTSITPEMALQHLIPPLKGITVVGVPGTGKTVFSMMIAKKLSKDLLFLNLGETKGGLVGQSEANLRRALNAIAATQCVAVIDDVDKAGLNVAQSGYSGDGGTSTAMVQMLLTEMSTNNHGNIWIFTGNRIHLLPSELIRAGRMDERFYVQRPDPSTRKKILELHLASHNMQLDSEEGLEDLAGNATEGWVGAELATLVLEGCRWAASRGKTQVNTVQMLERTKTFTPMCNQKSMKDDLAMMEEAAAQFRKIGRAPAAEKKTTTRATRTVSA